eukprot:9026443-Alexandrium_andersonii.AAC.1
MRADDTNSAACCLMRCNAMRREAMGRVATRHGPMRAAPRPSSVLSHSERARSLTVRKATTCRALAGSHGGDVSRDSARVGATA